MNILVNAIDALDERHERQAVVNAQYQSNQIHIHTTTSSNNQIIISIADSGVGIPENVQRQLFNPFFTTKPIGKGTGLGLSISYQIVVDQHQGDLRCISTPDMGTKFVITIPIHNTR